MGGGRSDLGRVERSWPSGSAKCGSVTGTSEVRFSWHARAGRKLPLGRRSQGRSGRSPCVWHRPPVSSRAPSMTNPDAARNHGFSSLTCGLQTSARRISGSLVARHRKVREDDGSSSSGTEAALASCRGKPNRESERVRGVSDLVWTTGFGNIDPRTTLRGVFGTTKGVPGRVQHRLLNRAVSAWPWSSRSTLESAPSHDSS